MGRIYQQNSRISHHTITTTGTTFSVPEQEDFTITGTSSAWTPIHLAESEFGVNEGDKELFIRTGNEIKGVDVWSNPIVTTFSGSGTSSLLFQVPVNLDRLNVIEYRIGIYPTSYGDANGFYYESGQTIYMGGTCSYDTSVASGWDMEFPLVKTRTFHFDSYSTGTSNNWIGTQSAGTVSFTMVNIPPATSSDFNLKYQYRVWKF